ncbi:MAG: DUF4398 domain-containing protein [Woeseiaceae bacterium]|nr:DUF4398 domain-containing protein [Woeseiaceae bacterium]
MPSIRSIALIAAALAAVLLMVAACEIAPPVQEMSDARQAIAVARDAGAETHATRELLEAEQHLQTAERELSAENYAEARREALAAKSKAQTARKLSEINQPDGE